MIVVWLPFLLAACNDSTVLEPHEAQTRIKTAWQRDQHALWVIDWPNAPLGGPLTVECWRSGARARYEILEAVPPALVGQTLVRDGERAWRYNRFDPPEPFVQTTPRLSPVTDMVDLVEQLLERPVSGAAREIVYVNSAPTQKITMTFSDGDQLHAWLDEETGLLVRLGFAVGAQQGWLEVRSVEPLLNSPPELFGVGPWLHSK